MRRAGVVAEPTGFGRGDHVCWCHDGVETWRAAATAFLREGADRGERLWYLGSRSADELIDELGALPDRDRLLRTSALEVSTYDGTDPAFPDRVADEMRRRVGQAVPGGFSGLRIASEVTGSISAGQDRRLRARLEVLCDRLVARGHAVLMCGYDRRQVSLQGAAVVDLLHPLRAGTGRADYCWFTADDDRWRLEGELDAVHASRLAEVMGTLDDVEEIEIDVGGLGFVDVAGARSLLEVARARSTRGLALHHPSPLLCRLLETTLAVMYPELRIVARATAVSLLPASRPGWR